MTAPHTIPCKPCNGTGVVPRVQRRLPNGELDPFDTIEWPTVTCEPCGGSGQVPLDLGTVQEAPAALTMPQSCTNHGRWLLSNGYNGPLFCPKCRPATFGRSHWLLADDGSLSWRP